MLNNHSVINKSMIHDNNGKDILLKKSFELLLQYGYDGVSVTDIQKATGLSRGLIYHYYKSKEDLFIEITERFFVDIFRINAKKINDFTIPDMIKYVEQKNLEVCRTSTMENGEEMSILNYDFLFYQIIRRNPEFAKKYKKIRADELKAWEIIVTNSLHAGIIKEGLNAQVIARIFICIIDGAWFNESIHQKPLDIVKKITSILNQYYEQIKK